MHTFLQTLLLTTVASADARYFSMKDKSVVRDEALRNKATPPAESAAPPQAAALQEVSSPAAGAETPAATTAAAVDTAVPPAPNASNVGGLKPLGSVSGIPSNFVEDQTDGAGGAPGDWTDEEKEAYPFSAQESDDKVKRVHEKVMKISKTKIEGGKAVEDTENPRTGTAKDFEATTVSHTTVLGATLSDGSGPLTKGADLGKVGTREVSDADIDKFIKEDPAEGTKGAGGTNKRIENAVASKRPGNQNFGKGDIAFQEMVIDTRALATATDQIQKELGKHQEALTDVKTQFESMQEAYKSAIGKVADGMKDVSVATFTPEDYKPFTEAEYEPAEPPGSGSWPPAVHQKFPSYDIVVPEGR